MSSESRIWEIRPFGSMRGGRELVIGLVPFNPSSPAYSTKQRREANTDVREIRMSKSETRSQKGKNMEWQKT
jgi:hypothetical protein